MKHIALHVTVSHRDMHVGGFEEEKNNKIIFFAFHPVGILVISNQINKA